MKGWIRPLKQMGACREALEWAEQYESLAEAWAKCKRGDWMLWLASQDVEQDSAEHKKVVLTACACARLRLCYVPSGQNEPRIAIETVEAWARDEATLEQVKAADDAHAAAYAVYDTYAVAHVVYDAAYAAAYAVYATDANVVRKFYPQPPQIMRKEGEHANNHSVSRIS